MPTYTDTIEVNLGTKNNALLAISDDRNCSLVLADNTGNSHVRNNGGSLEMRVGGDASGSSGTSLALTIGSNKDISTEGGIDISDNLVIGGLSGSSYRATQVAPSGQLVAFDDSSTISYNIESGRNIVLKSADQIQLRKETSFGYQTGLLIWEDSSNGVAMTSLMYNSEEKLRTINEGIEITGSINVSTNITVENRCTAEGFKLTQINTPPTSSTMIGGEGELRFTEDYIYVCVSDNTWKRVELNTW